MEIEWWQHACDKNPHCIAFVGLDDKFQYINDAWSKTFGWSSGQLIGKKRWQDITVDEDVGGDEKETEKIKRGERTEYYLSKEYYTPTGARIAVGLYVHRHPPFGTQLGYVVFAMPLNSRAEESLKLAFNDLETRVTILSEQHRQFETVMRRLDSIEEKQSMTDQNVRDVIKSLIKVKEINIEHKNELVGGDKNSSKSILYALIGFIVLSILLAGHSVYVEYQDWKVNLRQVGAPE